MYYVIMYIILHICVFICKQVFRVHKYVNDYLQDMYIQYSSNATLQLLARVDDVSSSLTFVQY